jgi:outer membrane protein assembly factor BamB
MTFSKRTLAIFMILLVFLSLAAGCANDPDNISDNVSDNDASYDFIANSEFVYVSEVIPFPSAAEGITNVDNVVLANNVVYFTAQTDEDEQRQLNISRLFSMDADGTDLSPLANYLPGSFPPGLRSDDVYINALHADSNGYLWTVEMRDLQRLEPPDDFDVFILRKLDRTGAEISKFDLSNIAEYIFVNALSIDNAGNIYIASMDSIYILDNQGNLLFSLDNPDFLAHFVRLSDGTVVFAVWQDGGIYLKSIDMERRTWGEIISLPSGVMRAHSVFQGTGEYLYLYNNNSYLNGFVAETGDHVNIFSWVDSTLSAVDITSVMFLPDGRIAASRQAQVNAVDAQPETELILLTKTSIDKLPDKIQLTLGTFNFDSSIRYAVEQFNRSSDTHRIQVIDYSEYGDFREGLLKLTTEIISGNSPDILDMMENACT